MTREHFLEGPRQIFEDERLRIGVAFVHEVRRIHAELAVEIDFL